MLLLTSTGLISCNAEVKSNLCISNSHDTTLVCTWTLIGRSAYERSSHLQHTRQISDHANKLTVVPLRLNFCYIIHSNHRDTLNSTRVLPILREGKEFFSSRLLMHRAFVEFSFPFGFSQYARQEDCALSFFSASCYFDLFRGLRVSAVSRTKGTNTTIVVLLIYFMGFPFPSLESCFVLDESGLIWDLRTFNQQIRTHMRI